MSVCRPIVKSRVIESKGLKLRSPSLVHVMTLSHLGVAMILNPEGQRSKPQGQKVGGLGLRSQGVCVIFL